MNIFNKKLKEAEVVALPINPIELYQTCAYKDGFGYLRGIQEEVLRAWHNKREQRDIICKMNTGSGKTLTGLLVLYSKLVEQKEPCLYVCPDTQLAMQTLTLAEQYGIPVCTFDAERKSEFPIDFLNSKKILICNFHKLFNGRSIFKTQKIKLGSIILDDAHKCVDIARTQSSLTLDRSHSISKSLLSLFEKSLKEQLPGTFHRLRDGDPEMLMKVPYWTWMDEQEKILKIIGDYIDKIKVKDVTEDIIFKWDFLTNNLLSYDCFFSGSIVEISPIHVPYHEIPAYHEARHRYILSATFEDDYDLIKDLGISYSSIIDPIVPVDRKDIGKRLILAPSRIDPKLTDQILRKFVNSYTKKYNVVVLVPSNEKAANWLKQGATLVDTNNIKTAIEKLKSSSCNFMVFVNRYDGIDLHSDLCRVLVIDGLPMYSSLQENYSETRVDSLRVGKKAQIIEQGLGRGVRSGGDYCVVYLMGVDLISFIGIEKNLAHFTPVTNVQLKLGINLLDESDETDALKLIQETANYCLTQDGDWIKYHTNELMNITSDRMDEQKNQRLNLAENERLSLVHFRNRNYESASDVILRQIIDKGNLSNKEQAWYYQLAGQLCYLGNRVKSNDLQSKACLNYSNMLHPPQGHSYNKILNRGSQSSIIKKALEEFDRPQDIIISSNGILNELVYNPLIQSNSFEKKLSMLGEFLGFNSQRPDDETGVGPDVLWCMSDGHFLILEAKSRRKEGEIAKDNIEQLQQSELWFKDKYGTDATYTAVTLQPSRRKGKSVFVDHHKVLDKESLELLHKNISQFVIALQGTHPKSHSIESISKLLEAYLLTPQLFRKTYLKEIK